MILGFKPQFKERILAGTKIHSIRENNSRRWSPGMKIQFATGIRTKNYNQFWEAELISLQKFEIKYSSISKTSLVILIDEYPINGYFHSLLAKNDGFDSVKDFLQFFNKDFCGWILHWTQFKY